MNVSPTVGGELSVHFEREREREIVSVCLCVCVCYVKGVRVSCSAKKKQNWAADRNCTFPRQRESRTLVSSVGPPKKTEQRDKHTFLEKQTSQEKQIRSVYFNIKISLLDVYLAGAINWSNKMRITVKCC